MKGGFIFSKAPRKVSEMLYNEQMNAHVTPPLGHVLSPSQLAVSLWVQVPLQGQGSWNRKKQIARH